MITTRPATKQEGYPRVSFMETKIAIVQKELYFAEKKEQQQSVERLNLLRRPETEITNRLLTTLEAEILSTQAIKTRLQDRIADFKKTIPVLLGQAKQNEKDLIDTRKKFKELNIEITGIDKRLKKSLEGSMVLIRERQKAIELLEKTVYRVSHLLRELKWSVPQDETVPSELAILDELKKLIDPHPNVVHWRGR